MNKLWWALVAALSLSSIGVTGHLVVQDRPQLSAAAALTTGPRPAPTRTVGVRLGTDGLQPAADLASAPTRAPAQQVLPGMLLVKRHHTRQRSHKVDQRFYEISATGSNDVPVAALDAYHHAAAVLATSDPSCHLPWTFLAAIGRVESDHGRYGGSQLAADGVSRPEILGPVLDGAGPFAAIRDSDNGRLDHNRTWDRAVGQMQFLPSTWAVYGRDGDGDGVANPDDINDSALAAGTYLCAGGMDLSSSAGMAQAAWRYNQSDYYVALVLAFQRGYATGVFVLPSPPAPDQPARHQRKKHHHHAKHPTTKQTASPRHHQAARKRTSDAGRTSGSTSGKHTKPAPKPSDPTPSPTPTPTPTPSPTALSGTLAVSGSTYKLGGYTLDLGTGLSQQAPVDLDADGTVETWDGELQGLVGQNVKLTALLTGTTAKVLTVEGHAYP